MLVALGCSKESSATRVIETRIKHTTDSNLLVEPKNESPVKVIGDYENEGGDGEHEWGYSVTLWKQEDKIYGLISGGSALRLIGDAPIGLLEDVEFDSKTGKLSFKAKLSVGSMYNKNEGWVPSRDIYKFEGVLTEKELKGKLFITEEICGAKCNKTEKVKLKYSKEWSSLINEYPSYAEWKANYEVTLKRRGPKW